MEIKLSNVDFITKNPHKKVLNNISLNIKSSSITTFVGQSGSGKTCFAELIDLLALPSSGDIYYDEFRINSMSKSDDVNKIKGQIGLVFQNPEEQFFCNTVEKEIGFGLNFLNKDIEKIKKRISDALKMVNMDDSYLTRNPFSLSSGEKRKIAIASILAINPTTIILDEPTLGLDMKSKKSLIKIIKMLKTRYDKTIIIFTKDVELAHIVADEVFVLHNGEIVLSGNKYEVFSQDIENYGLKKPKIIEFEQLVYKEKNIKLMYRDEINDLMKDVYRNVK